MYIRAMQLGCRCIELDLWEDGTDVIIYHGETECLSMCVCVWLLLSECICGIHVYVCVELCARRLHVDK